VNREALDALPGDENGAIVSGRVGVEKALQQGDAHATVELDAAVEMSAERLFSRQDDESPDTVAREVGEAPNEHVGDAALRNGLLTSEAPHRQPFEELAQFLLKDDYDDDDQGSEETLQDPYRQLEIEHDCEDVENSKQQNAARDEDRACVPNPNDGKIKQARDEKDVDDITDLKLGEGSEHDKVHLAQVWRRRQSRGDGLRVIGHWS